MTWRVGFKKSAEDELAEIWMRAPDRQAVTASANHIEQMLRDDPWGCGESRGGSLHVVIEEPLAALYEIDDEDYFVHVLKVWRVPLPPGP